MRASLIAESPLRKERLSGTNKIFGWKHDGNLVAIYTEDDENWHLTMTFDGFWLDSFKEMVASIPQPVLTKAVKREMRKNRI